MTEVVMLPNAAELETGPELHVVTITPFYPTATDDARGCFIAEPLGLMHALRIRQTVISVQSFYRAQLISNPNAFPSEQARYLSLPGGVGLPLSGAFLFANLVARVRKLHRLHPIQLIHAHAALPCGHAAFLLSKELNIPFVVTAHGLDAYFMNQVKGRAGKWCQHISRMVYESASRVICISETVRDRVLERVKQSVLTDVVYNGVDSETFHPSNGNSHATSILCVGNLIPSKGQDFLLKAFAQIHPQFPGLSCEIIGDGPALPALLKIAADLSLGSKVIFSGRKSRLEVAEAMRKCTVFALPSTYEGLGCVYLEAMASGKAAIGCRGQGIAEVIEHGVNGWLVEPGDSQDLAFSLSSLLENQTLRNEIGTQARNSIVRNFTIAHQANRLAQIYRECAG